MVTLNAKPGMWLCRIMDSGAVKVTDAGAAVQQNLPEVNRLYSQVKCGQYQIMPDHLHVMVHVVRDLPADTTLQEVLRSFKLGVNKTIGKSCFQAGSHHTLIFSDKHLQREVAYIRDNVRRYLIVRQNPDYFKKAFKLEAGVAAGAWGFGNRFLLEHPRRVQVQFSRSMGEATWLEERKNLLWMLDQGYVFVSPFVSPYEAKARDLIMERGGRIIHLIEREISERYKPGGQYFNWCCEGRVLELSGAALMPRFGESLRERFLRLNRLAGDICITQ